METLESNAVDSAPTDPSSLAPAFESSDPNDQPSGLPWSAVPWPALLYSPTGDRPILSASTGARFNTTVAEGLRLHPPSNRPGQQHSLPNSDGSPSSPLPTLNSGQHNNFFQRATWSPDGSFLLTSSNDQCARVFQLPTDTLTTAAATGSPEPLEAFQCLRQSHGILALDWYPHVDYYHPSTWCFVSSTRDHPVHLWNAYTGKVQATYWAEDDKGQKIAAYALAFHPDGQSLYTGYHDAIHIFDVQRPGMARQTVRLTPTRNSKAGQKGIVSTIAFNPDRSGLYAVGTFSNSVGLYADTAPGALLHLKRPPIGNGLSQCQFSPCGNYLYLTGRTHYSVFCWDIRQTGKFLFCIDRTLGTSQRISFDVDPTGQFLASGTREGTVQIYDISGPLQAQPVTKDPLLVQSFPGHHDAIGATQFHPTLPLMATCSGQREALDDDDDDDDEGNTRSLDNSVRIWRWDAAEFPEVT